MKGFGQRECKVTLFGQKVTAREIVLPMPPSENDRLEASVKHFTDAAGKKRHAVRFHNTKKYNQWLALAQTMLMKGKLEQFETPVTVITTVVFPDNLRRDNQNREKALFDAMTKSGCVYRDDCLIKQHFTREEVIKGQSFVLVYVIPYAQLPLDDMAVSQEYLAQKYAQAMYEEEDAHKDNRNHVIDMNTGMPEGYAEVEVE